MALHRIFLFWSNPLFQEVVRLLLNHPQIDWVGESSNGAINWEIVRSLQPDTILVEEHGESHPQEIVSILEAGIGNVRIVGLNLNDNQMRTYHRVQRTVSKADDLLQWILNDTD